MSPDTSIRPAALRRDASALSLNELPIRVLVIIPSLAVGGAETDLVRTLPKLDRSRIEAVVHTFLELGELADKLADRGIEVVGPFSPQFSRFGIFVRRSTRAMRALVRRYLPSSNGGRVTQRLSAVISVASRLGHWLLTPLSSAAYLLAVLRLARPIARFIREANFDIVHVILPNAYLVGVCANAFAGRRPLAMSRLSLNLYQRKDRLVGWLERRVLHRTVGCAIGNARAILEELQAEGIGRSKLQLIYNGIDVGAFTNEMVDSSEARRRLGIADRTLVFTVIGNLFPYKGHEDLLAALHAASIGIEPEWVCLVVGRDVDGHRANLERRCAELGLTEKVRFLGPRGDVPAILSAADISVSASHQEGLPNNVIEAMCAGLPVVATAVGGVPELIVDGKTGILVPPQNPRHMAAALRSLANSPSRRTALGTAARTHIEEHFGIDRTVDRLQSTYLKLARKSVAR